MSVCCARAISLCAAYLLILSSPLFLSPDQTAVAQDSGNDISSPPREAPARKRVRRILVENEGKDEEPSHASEMDSAEADVPVKPRRKAAGAAQGKITGMSQLQAWLKKQKKYFTVSGITEHVATRRQ